MKNIKKIMIIFAMASSTFFQIKPITEAYEGYEAPSGVTTEAATTAYETAYNEALITDASQAGVDNFDAYVAERQTEINSWIDAQKELDPTSTEYQTLDAQINNADNEIYDFQISRDNYQLATTAEDQQAALDSAVQADVALSQATAMAQDILNQEAALSQTGGEIETQPEAQDDTTAAEDTKEEVTTGATQDVLATGETGQEQEPASAQDTTLTSWFKNSLSKVWNSIKSFFWTDANDPVLNELTGTDYTAVKNFQNAKDSYFVALNEFGLMNTSGTYKSFEEAYAAVQAGTETTPAIVDAVNNLATAKTALNTATEPAKAVLEKYQSEAASSALNDVNSYITQAPLDATNQEIASIKQSLSQVNVAQLEQQAKSSAFKQVYGVKDPYAIFDTLRIEVSADNPPTQQDLQNALNKMGITDATQIESLILSNSAAISNVLPNETNLTNTFMAANPLFETIDDVDLGSSSALFDLFDGYNILTDAYSIQDASGNYYVSERVDSNGLPMTQTWADTGLNAIQQVFDGIDTSSMITVAGQAITQASQSLGQIQA